VKLVSTRRTRGKPAEPAYVSCTPPALESVRPLLLTQKNGGPVHVGLAPDDSRGWCAFVARMGRAGFSVVKTGKLRGVFLADVEAHLRAIARALSPRSDEAEPLTLGRRLEMIAAGVTPPKRRAAA